MNTHTHRIGLAVLFLLLTAAAVVQAQAPYDPGQLPELTTSASVLVTPFDSTAPPPCPEVLIAEKYEHAVNPRWRHEGWDTAVTCDVQQITLTVEPYFPVQYFNGTYDVKRIQYNPPDPTFHQGTSLPNNADDQFCAPVNFSNVFPFYFFGIKKTHFAAGGNGIVTFNQSASGFCSYNVKPPLPWPNEEAKYRDAIYGVYQDTDPGGNMSGYQGIWYGVQGDWPCHKIIVSYNELPWYPNGSNTSNRQSYQIVCYEGTNIIEVHVKRRRRGNTDCGWCNWGLIGIQNATGQPQVQGPEGSSNDHVVDGKPAYFAPAGCNTMTAAEEIDNVAYRFTPMGSTDKILKWFRIDDNGDTVYLSNDASGSPNEYFSPLNTIYGHPNQSKAFVKPTTTTTYYCKLYFISANGDEYNLIDSITIGVDTANTLLLSARSEGESNDSVFKVCQGQTVRCPLSYTQIQKPDIVQWTIKRIENGTMVDLPAGLLDTVRDADNKDTAIVIHPDQEFYDRPGNRNKIDSLYLHAFVRFVTGCNNYDSVLVLVYPNFDTTTVAAICDGEGGYTWSANDRTYTTSTTDQHMLQSEAGCDSLCRLNLTVHDLTPHTVRIERCEPYTWENNVTYYETNNRNPKDTLWRKDHFGCDSIVQLDFVLTPVIAHIKSDIPYFDYDHLDVVLTDMSEGSGSRLWRFPTGSDQTQAVAYYSIPADADSADITLIAYSIAADTSNGHCADTTVLTLPFRKEALWMPNIFTPDDPTSANNTFGSHSKNTLRQEMYIYNRMGNLVFHCVGVDCAWDGRDLGGNPCPQGAYAYILRYTTTFEPGITNVLKGSVTLLR